MQRNHDPPPRPTPHRGDVVDLSRAIAVDIRRAARLLRLPDDGARKLAELTAPLIRPAGLVLEAFVDARGEGTVRIGGQEFHSRVLASNLKDVNRVFPFLLTIGGELERAASREEDLLLQYQMETMGDLALESAGQALGDHLKNYGLDKVSSMSPGSLEDWPITEQPKLFSLLGGGDRLGIRLSDSLLMIPRKSVSGIYFPTEKDFLSCRLCGRENCPGRRAVFDPDLRKELGLEKSEPR
jgi:hypothetical protein